MNDSNRVVWLLSRGIGILIFIGGFFSVLWWLTPLQIQSLLTATGIFATSLLTFALIVVYRDIGIIQSSQAEVQKEQTEILSRQEKLMEAGYRPHLIYDQIRVVDRENMDIGILIENQGSGFAEDFHIRCDIQAKEGRDIIHLETVNLENNIDISSFPTTLSPLKDPEIEEKFIEKDRLNPDSRQTYAGRLSFPEDQQGSPELPAAAMVFKELINSLDSQRYPVFCQLSILYRDAIGNRYADPVFVGKTNGFHKYPVTELVQSPVTGEFPIVTEERLLELSEPYWA